MIIAPAKVLARYGVKARLLLAFGLMVTLTLAVGGVGWWGVSNIQRSLDVLHTQSLPELARSLALAEHSASLVAQAPFVANARILFHLDEESARLRERLDVFKTLVQELHDPAAAPLQPLPGLALEALAARLEGTLLELVEVTRQGIFLTARVRDRQYRLSGIYEALENRIVEALDGPGGEPDEALAAALGEIHRVAGALTAAATAEDDDSLRALEAGYEQGRGRLQDRLERLADGLAARLARPVGALLALGAGEDGIFALRRRQFGQEDRRNYLLTTGNVLSAALNARVAAIVERVKQTTEGRSAAATAVLGDSQARILLLGLICLVAALFSATYVVRDLGGNLSAVTQAMMRLAGGDRHTRVPAVARPDEIGRLARAFDVFRANMFRLDEASRRLAESSKLLETVFQNMNDGLAVFDAQGRLVSWNQQFLDLYGLPASGIGVGRRWPRRFEERLPDGRVLELRSNPMPEGGFVTICTDLTERKAVEDQLRQAQKMESVGQLTGGLAHDFNNLLTVIIGNLTLLQEALVGHEELRRKALRALEAADRGATITQRLLAFSRKQRLQPQRVQVNDLVEGMLDLLDCSLGTAVAIETDLAPDLWPVVIDPGQLENALMNLALNSRDAMPEGGQLVIETRNVSADAGAVQARRGIGPGDYALVSVRDTGAGMPPEVVEHAFEPFFTTKEVGAGSGLGLSMVYGFIQQSGGVIEIDSTVGSGTIIRLYLPRAEAEAGAEATTRRAPEATAAAAGDGAILVVEDDPGVRQVAVDLLTGLGYRTVQAGSGSEALARLDEGRPIVLFTDVILTGGMSGPELAREAQRRCPGLRVLYCSGYTRDKLLAGGYLEDRVDLIEKPYTKEVLAETLRGMLPR